MIYILLISGMLLGCVQEFIKKCYLLKYKNGDQMVYNFWSVFGAIPIFFLSAGGILEFHLPTLGYSALYALGYCMALIFSMKALAEGSMALTVMLLAFTVVVPISFGIVVLHEPLTIFGVIAIPLLIAALILIVGPNKAETNNKISLKWLFFVFLAILGNGSCSIIVKLHRIQYPGQYSSELMLFALVIVLIVCGILAFSPIKKAKTPTEKPLKNKTIKATIIFALATGICNGMSNKTIVELSELMDLSSMSIIRRVGSLVLTYLVSVYIFREKLTVKQTLGCILGIAAAVLFNM